MAFFGHQFVVAAQFDEVAAVEDDQPVAGVVFAPDLDETYTATAGGGAWPAGPRSFFNSL